MRRVLRHTIIPLILMIVLCGALEAVAQTGAKTEQPVASKKVTVTLVRWPYT